MPYNAVTGTFTRTANSFSDPVNNTVINPTDATSLFNDYDTGLSTPTPTSLVIEGARTITSAAGILDNLSMPAKTTTITGGTAIARLSQASFYQPTYTDVSAVTITDAANVYIDGPPIAAGSVTATRSWSLMSKAGNVWINGTGGANGTDARLLIGNLVPSDWPVDAFGVTSTLTGQNAVGILSAPVLGTAPGSNKIAYAYSAQSQMAASQAWTTYYGLDVQSLVLNSGASVTNQYGLAIEALSGAGTTNQAIWVKGDATTGRVGLGTGTAQAHLHVNDNAVGNTTPPAGTTVYYTGADSGTAGVTIDAFGIPTGVAQYTFRATRGTGASPNSALQTDDFIANIVGKGNDGVGYSSGSQVSIAFNASSLWTNANHETHIRFYTTPNGSTAIAEALRILGAGNLKFTNTANFAANNGRTVTISNVGPAAIAATIAKWLTFQDSSGTVSYIPVWQ
jgi:hypothetical protein